MQCLAFRKIFNQFSHISYLLVISFTTKFKLKKSNYFCGFNINASENETILFLPLPLSLSLSLSLSLGHMVLPWPNKLNQSINQSIFAYNPLLCNI